MEFLKEFEWAAVGVVMVVEYLISVSKLKSNSTIELALNVLKFVFGMDKKQVEDKSE